MNLLVVKFLMIFMLLTNGIWGNNLESAKQEAQTEHKLILLYFSGSDWCGPCIKLKHDVLEEQSFIDFSAQHLVMVRADFPRMKKNLLSPDQTAYNEKLAEKYNSKGKFPLTVLLSADGKVLKEWEGYTKDMSPDYLKKQIESYL